MDTIGVAGRVPVSTSSGGSSPATTQEETPGVTCTASTQTYRVRGASRPGGHGRILCNTTKIRADTGSVSDGYRAGPAELLCAALAACLLKNIERYSELLPFQYEVASVEVEAERQDAPPRMTRIRYRIEIASDEPAHRVDLLHRNIRKYGTITNTLAAACELTGEIRARPIHRNGEELTASTW